MLERLSASHDASKRQSNKGDRMGVFGTKKQASFHVVISELRAELMSLKLASGPPCTLLWVRGDTVHVTDDSVGVSVLSWTDTYFSQLVTLQVASSGFKAKGCKFKVQQKGKTVAKTASLDLSRYCSDSGQPREQAVSLPLQPSGTLYFVICTTVATELQQQQHQQRLSARSGALSAAASTKQLNRLSTNSLASTTLSIATMGPPSASTVGPEPRPSNTGMGAGLGLGNTARASVMGGGTTAAPSEDGDRPSSARRVDYQLRSSAASIGSGMGVGGGGGGGGGGTSLSNSLSKLPQSILDSGANAGVGTGSIFKRLTRGGGTKQSSTAGGGNDNSPAPSLQLPIVFRKLESTQGSSPTGGAASGNTARSVSLAGSTGPTAGNSSSGGMPYSPAKRTIQSFTGGATRLGKSSSSSALTISHALALDNGTEGVGAGGGVAGGPMTLMRASTDSSSDMATGGADRGNAAAGVKGGSWGGWWRGWGGRSSEHSATSASQPTSFPGGGCAYGNAPEPQYSGSLEAAIKAANEADELRNFALDLLHERDEWRCRALSAQDAFGRAQAARGSAARDAQRLELRVRQYQDELGRRTDGSLLQELVEAKVRIAELANENLRLRRQITHMGPLFYDNGEEGSAGGEARS